MSFLVDPPVGPESDPADIRAWITALERMREERAHEPDVVRMTAYEQDRAQGWLNSGGELADLEGA